MATSEVVGAIIECPIIMKYRQAIKQPGLYKYLSGATVYIIISIGIDEWFEIFMFPYNKTKTPPRLYCFNQEACEKYGWFRLAELEPCVEMPPIDDLKVMFL